MTSFRPVKTLKTSNSLEVEKNTKAELSLPTNFAETVILVIGETAKCLVVHKDLLCYYSTTFTRALKNSVPSAEGATLFISYNPDVVDQFARWLYTQTLEGLDLHMGTEDGINLLCGLFIFGNRWKIPKLQDAVVRYYIKQLKSSWYSGIPQGHIAWVYKNTEVDSPLRRLIVDDFLRKTCLGSSITEDKILPQAFFAQLFARLRDLDVPMSKVCEVCIGTEDYYMKGHKPTNAEDLWADAVVELMEAAE